MLVRRYRLLAPVEIRVPERLYLASAGGRPLRPRPTRQRAVARQPAQQAAERRGQERGGAQAGRQRLRRFQLPPLRVRKTDQTLLQPDFAPDLPVLSEITLPEIFFWAPLPAAAPRVRKPFVMPGSAEPFAQPPRLDAPPQLTAPNWETLTLDVQVAAALEGRPDALLAPSISLPIRMPDFDRPTPQTHVSVDRSVGDPLSVLALNWRLRPLREELLVPPGNQLAEIFGPGARGEGEAGGGSAESRGVGASGERSTEAAATVEPSGRPAEAAMAEPPKRRDAGAESATRARQAAVSRSSSSSTDAPRGRAANGARESPLSPTPSSDMQATAARTGPAPPVGVRMEHPPGGVFDVVVVQPAPMDGFAESTGALSGRPVYSVFLNVGAAKPWILQYCIPGEDQTTVISGGVVRLGNPAPVSAPYPRVTYLPALRSRPGSYMMVHGYLGADGRFQQLEVLRAADRDEAQSVLPVLERWEFRPATREGRPVQVEILLAIPRP